MFRKLAPALILSLGLAAASVARAEPPPGGEDGDVAPPPPGEPGMDGLAPHGHFGKLMHKLGLSDDQKAKVKTIREKYKPKMKDAGEAVKKALDAFATVMVQHPPIDQARAEHKKVVDAMEAAGDIRFDMMYEIADVLTPAQRTQLQDLQKEMMEKWHKHRQPKGD